MKPSMVASLVTVAFMVAVAVGTRLGLAEHLLAGDWRTSVFSVGMGVVAAILWMFIYRGRQGDRTDA